VFSGRTNVRAEWIPTGTGATADTIRLW